MNPTTGELKIMIDNLEGRQSEKHEDVMSFLREIKQDVKETMSQAKYTNGRVSRHDIYFRLLWWSLGALASFTVFSFPYLRSLVQVETRETVNSAIAAHDGKISEMVAQSIASALSRYNIDVSN